MKSLFFHYRTGDITDVEVYANIEAFKKIKKNDMPTDANEEGMETLKSKIKGILDSQNKGVSLNVKTPKKRIAV
jgi:predicted lipase